MTSVQLASVSMASVPLRRTLPSGFSFIHPEDAANYDETTLWYDAFWRTGRTYLICPKLHGIEKTILAARFLQDDQPAGRPRINRLNDRYDILSFRAKHRPARISITLNGETLSGPVTNAQIPPNSFKNRNVGVTLSYNNDLKWIEDYARYHHKAHNMQAALFFDHSSTLYAPQEIDAALMRGGLQGNQIICVDHPYGIALHNNDGHLDHRGEMMQTALLNIAKMRFLPECRAALINDIDELVWAHEEPIFDTAYKRLTGYVRIPGQWRYPAKGALQPFSHSDHIYRTPTDAPCPAKYCVSPKGWFWRAHWGVHALDIPAQKTIIPPQKIGFWHCAGITTSWKNKERYFREPILEIDKDAQSGLAIV